MYQIVDSHVHLLPGRLAEKVRAFFGSQLTETLVYPLDHTIILNRLHQAGVRQVWNLPYAHKKDVAAGLNQASAATVAEFKSHPVQIIGGATIHPDDSNPLAILSEAFDVLGLRVLKLHCSVGNFWLDTAQLAPVWEFVAAHQLPTIIHIGHNVSGHTEAGELAVLTRVAETYPTAPLIIAHCGHHAGEAALDLVEKYPSVYADLTPVVTEPVRLPANRVRQLATKILFGSDAPNVGLTVEESLTHLETFKLTAEQTAAIVGGNARRLLSQIRPSC